MKRERTIHFFSTFLFVILLLFTQSVIYATFQNTVDLPSAQIKQKKVLFIGIDGFVWKTISATNTPNLHELMKNSYVSTNALAEVPTISGNGWAALLTGVGLAKHQSPDNSFSNTNFGNYPTFFHEIKKQHPELKTASVVVWNPINDNIISEDDITSKINASNDEDAEHKAINEIIANNTDVLFVHFDDVDHAGHANTYHPTVEKYRNAVKNADARVGRLLAAVKSRPTYKQEDWLIVVSTDHGGGTSHGGSSYVERNAFIIVNNSRIQPQIVQGEPQETVENTDYPITTIDFKNGIYGELPQLKTLDLNENGSFTIEFRVRATSSTGDPVIIGNKSWADGKNKGIIIANNKGFIKANFGDGTSKRADIEAIDLKDQKWHHVSVVVDRNTKKIAMYDAGELVVEGNINNVGDLQSELAFSLGQDAFGNYGFSGNIAEFRIFKSALTARMIKDYSLVSLNENHPKVKDLVLYTKGNEGSGANYTGSLGMPNIVLKAKEDAPLHWSAQNDPIVKKTIDYNGAPYLFSVPPTILNFLGLQIPANYDGKSLVNY